MPRIAFDELPPHARLWIFAAARPLDDTERGRVLDEVDAFLDHWAAHGVALTAGRDVRHDRFILVAVDELTAGVSGCSIDALVRQMKALERELDVELVNNMPVLYRDGERIARVSRRQFSDLASAGTVGPATRVFDNTVASVGQLREGRWEVPAGEAWHARAFFRDA